MTSMNGKSNRSPNRACIVSWGLGTGGQNSSGKIVSILNPSDDLVTMGMVTLVVENSEEGVQN